MAQRVAFAAGATLAAGIGLYLWWKQRKGSTPRPPFLDNPKPSDPRKKMTLVRKDKISHDTWRFVFALDHPEQPLGLPVGKHLTISCPPPVQRAVAGEWNGQTDTEANNKTIARKYTPTSKGDVIGQVELVVKIYKGQPGGRFADGGKMSLFLDQMQLQDTIDVKGPIGRIQYLGNGQFRVSKDTFTVTKIGMIAGGTGITPMLQVMQNIADNAADKTAVKLIFGNQSPADILVRQELDQISASHPSQLTVRYTVDRTQVSEDADPDADYSWPPPAQAQLPESLSQGFVDEAKMKAFLPPAGDDTVVFLCGPPGMVNSSKKTLDKLGYKYYSF